MSSQVMPPDNAEIEIKPDTTTTIGNANVQSTANEVNINPDAIGPVKKFEFVHIVNGNNKREPNVTGVRIPFEGKLLQIVKKTDGTSQWSLDGTVLGTYADRNLRLWRPDIAKSQATLQTNNVVYYTKVADPLAPNPPHPIWSSTVTYANFVSFKLMTTRP